jgi:hypothetical protein
MKPIRKEHTKKLFSARYGFMLRISALAGLVGLLVFIFGLPYGSDVRAAPVPLQTPGYDGPTQESNPTTETGGYDGPGDETPIFPQVSPSPAVAFTDIVEPTEALTPTQTGTLPPDVFRTEDAEINGAQTTPVTTETVGPTITLFTTPTATKRTPRPTTTSNGAKEKDEFIPDWGLFWIGFSLPVLGSCGVVLYLLDRRPDLFRRGK